MTYRLVGVDDSYNLPDNVNIRDINLPDNLQPAALSATYEPKGAAAAAAAPKLDKTEAATTYATPAAVASAVAAQDIPGKVAAAVAADSTVTAAAATAVDAAAAGKNIAIIPNVTTGSDEFAGSSLDKTTWTVVREDTAAYRVASGFLEIDAAVGTLSTGTNSAKNVILQAAPASGAWTAEAKITAPVAAATQQAGILLYVDDNNYFQLGRAGRTGSVMRHNAYYESIMVLRNTTADWFEAPMANYTSTYYLRLTSDGTDIKGYWSPDNITWTQVGRSAPASTLTNARFGMFAISDSGAPLMTAKFEYFRVNIPQAFITESAAGSAFVKTPSTITETENFTVTLDPLVWGIVRPDAAGYRVNAGNLEIDTLAGSLSFTTNSAKNVIVRAAPAGAWTAETKLNLPITAATQQAGLILYWGDNDFILMGRNGRAGSVTRTQFFAELGGNQRNTTADFSEVSNSTAGTDAFLRIVSDGTNVRGYTSPDGKTWTTVGRPVNLDLFNKGRTTTPHVGLYAMSDTGTAVITAKFDYFKLTHTGKMASGTVVPVQWGNMLVTPATGTLADLERAILQDSDKYALNTWFPTTFGAQAANAYLDFGGTEENQIRHPAAAAYALAASLGTGAYSQAVTGITPAAATAIVVRLVGSLAFQHRANNVNGWGGGLVWQSAMWAGLTGHAAWMIWDSLPVADQNRVHRMMQREADRFNTYAVPYWTLRDGTVVTPGDSKAEENPWNAYCLQVACAMIPDHPRAQLWMQKNLELLISGMAKPSDVNSNTILHGQPLKDWLGGWNINEDGTLYNHGIIHPDYMAAVVQNMLAVTVAAQAGKPAPKAALWNIDLLYQAMVDKQFTSPPYVAPGGTIYKPGSAEIYYPEGTDWGADRRMNNVSLDSMVRTLGVDTLASTKGDYWEAFHAQAARDMQLRGTTGQTYQPGDQDTYAGREQWVAAQAANAYLTRHMGRQGLLKVSNLPASELK